MSYDLSFSIINNSPEYSGLEENENLEKALSNYVIKKQTIERMKTVIQNEEEESITRQWRMLSKK